MRDDRRSPRRTRAGSGRVGQAPAEWGVAAARPAPQVVIIAGPNGAGKTTFAREYLPREASCPIFVNADLIAAGISPFAPEFAAVRAGRIMLAEIRTHAGRGESFAFETTLAGRMYARRIPLWQAQGYHVKLVYLGLNGPDLAVSRVALRVRQGGHDVPEGVIRRRFEVGRRNFDAVYRPLVDSWFLYDNSGSSPILIAEGGRT